MVGNVSVNKTSYFNASSATITSTSIERQLFMDTIFDTRLRHPFTCIVAGPTCCGKTELVKKIVLGRNYVIDKPIDRVIWCYCEWQQAYNDLTDQIEFVKNIVSPDELNPAETNLVLLDDMMDIKDDKIQNFFIKSCHHRNASCIHIVQNLFNQGKNHRTCSLNTHYFVLFKNPRDSQQIQTLGRQMFPNRKKYLTNSFEDATRNPYGYLLVDAKPDTAEHLRLRTDIVNPSKQIAYVPEDYKYYHHHSSD